MDETENAIQVLEKYIPDDEIDFVKSIFYGGQPRKMQIPETASSLSHSHDFQIEMFEFEAKKEELRAPRLVTIGIIQNSIVLPTDASIREQKVAIHEKVEKLIEAAALCGVNVLCLQETWPMPFVFATREKTKWTDFAEDVKTGPTTQLCCKLAAKYGMVIVSPIFERDPDDVFWNSAVVISHTGKIIGITRKVHIPKFGDSNESNNYMESTLGHPVFQTAFGRIGVDICYGRHHPQNWLMYGINGAEIVFNPCATRGSGNQNIWCLEARAAAVANNFFACGINRVGKETFEGYSDDIRYFGQSYIAAPDGSRTPELSDSKDALLAVKVDLNLCRQMSQRLGYYAESLSDVCNQKMKALRF